MSRINSWAKKADEKKTNKETKTLVIKEVFWINDYLIFISQFETSRNLKFFVFPPNKNQLLPFLLLDSNWE